MSRAHLYKFTRVYSKTIYDHISLSTRNYLNNFEHKMKGKFLQVDHFVFLFLTDSTHSVICNASLYNCNHFILSVSQWILWIFVFTRATTIVFHQLKKLHYLFCFVFFFFLANRKWRMEFLIKLFITQYDKN